MSVEVQRTRPPIDFEWPARLIDKKLVDLPDPQQFKSILPILSRLPRAEEEDEDSSDVTSATDYLTRKNRLSLPETLNETVLYTASRLPVIDETAIYLWQALHLLKPLTADYAGDFGSEPIPTASGCPFAKSQSRSRTALDLVRSILNWDSLTLPHRMQGVFYGVVFRSKRRSGSESTNLYRADKLAHEEAVASGGLLMYWYGVPDPGTGANLATCVWTSREDAVEASRLPMHRLAAVCARDAYQSFELSRYAVVKRRGEEKVRIEEWNDDVALLLGDD